VLDLGGINTNPQQEMGLESLRYKIEITGDKKGENLIGDGIVIKPDKIISVYDTENNKHFSEKELNDINQQFSKNEGSGKGWHGESERHSRARKEGHADFLTQDFFTMDSLVEFYDHLKQQNDFVEDIVQPQAGTKIGTGQTSAEKELARLQVIGELDKIFRQMKQNLQIPSVDIEKLKSEIGAISETPTQNPLQKGVQEYPMRPVLSSFIKGAGAHNGKLLLEFHHSPGKIWSYDVEGQGAKFFQDLLNSGSKGGWVWDKILGKPSVFGMQKGKIYSYNQGGNQQYFTSKGAQFVHLYGRPTLLSSNPVGYTMPQEQYESLSEQWKKFKEEVVEPPTSRQAIRIGKSKANQEQKYNIWQQIQKAFQKGGKKDFVYVGNVNDFTLTNDSDNALEKCTSKGYTEEECFKFFSAAKEKSKPKYKQVKTQVSKKEILEKRKANYLKKLEQKLDRNISLTAEESNKIVEYSTKIEEKEQKIGKIKPKGTLKELHQQLKWTDESIQDWTKELARITEWSSKAQTLLEKASWVNSIEIAKENLRKLEPIRKEREKEYKYALSFEQEKYLTPYHIKSLGLKINDKIRIDRELFSNYRDNFKKEDLINQIHFVNETFESLPKSLKEDIELIRIYLDCNTDDPDRVYNPEVPSVGGYYSYSKKAITINLGKSFLNRLNGKEWEKEIVIHETAHSLDYHKILSYEKNTIENYYIINKQKLQYHKEYAARDEQEFFAECYTNAYLGNKDWFLTYVSMEVYDYFKVLMKKYDFIPIIEREIITDFRNKTLKFSFDDGDQHIFGKVNVPNEFPMDKAQKLVNEGKASWTHKNKKISGNYIGNTNNLIEVNIE